MEHREAVRGQCRPREGTAALLLPYWFSREIVLTLLLAVVALASGLRLRRRGHLRFA